MKYQWNKQSEPQGELPGIPKIGWSTWLPWLHRKAKEHKGTAIPSSASGTPGTPSQRCRDEWDIVGPPHGAADKLRYVFLKVYDCFFHPSYSTTTINLSLGAEFAKANCLTFARLYHQFLLLNPPMFVGHSQIYQMSHTYIHIHIHIHIYRYVYIYMYIYVYICVYMYIYIYVYIYIYTHMCVYVYIYICILSVTFVT